MDLETRIKKLRNAIKENRAKEVIEYKFNEYMKDYDNKEKSINDKIRHRELFQEYFKYMRGR